MEGRSIYFWSDHWSGNAPLKLVFPNFFAVCEDQRLALAALGDWSGGEWKWLLSWMHLEDTAAVADLTNLSQILQEVSLSQNS